MKNTSLLVIGLALGLLLCVLLPGCSKGGGLFGLGGDPGENLLYGKAPSKMVGVRREARLTDNVVAPRGDHWKSELTAIFSSSQAFAEYDLGAPTPIAAAYLQGDNNDNYLISGSLDGVEFAPLWEGSALSIGGLQPRFADGLNATARYIRVSAHGGDGSYGLSEVQIFKERPSAFPPQPKVVDSIPPDEVLRNKILALGLALALAVVLTWRGAPIWWTLIVLLAPLAAAVDAGRALSSAWPPGTREVALVRAVAAAVACLVVIREVFAPAKLLADRRVAIGSLAVCAGLALATFYNLGHPQFHDHKAGRPGFVHNFDMRVYFPIAKYFKELRFDGLYLGSVAAYVDDDKSVSLQSLGHQQLRSLKTHRMVKVSEVEPEIREVQRRFSPQRWADFKKDMRYFRENMGVRDYLGSMSDHGGNATPVWFLFGYALFAKAWANNGVLTITGLIDPVLLLVGFWSIYRAFGLRTALVSAVIWGANDFYMFGTCWAGATLRHDWMAYLAMGISALKLERWKLAGALLMLSGMIRAFPFFALVGAAMPAFWWIIEYWREHKRLPSLAVFRQAQRPLLLVAATATITGVVLYLASSLMFGFHSWVEWYHKVSLLHRDPHVNHVSLRALIAGPDGIHNRVLAARQNLFFGGIAVFALMVLISARGKDLARSAALGTLMIPVVFHPANYYIHFIFVLPMLVLEHDKQTETGKSWPISPANGGVWISLLLLVAAEYMCAIEKDLGLRFYYSSALLMITITAVLLLGLARDFQLARQLVPAMAGGGPVAPPVPAVEPEPPGAEPDSEPIAAETNGSAEPGADSPANDRPSAESDTESSEPERPEEPAAS